ncbi:MAG: glycosyltransferase family 4 protein [Planctomycetota bacterium]
MKVLLCHNYYRHRGGEDFSFEQEAQILRSHGHDVIEYTISNDQIPDLGKLALTAKTFWNRQSYREVFELMKHHKPVVMHCTNTFPLLSPSIYQAAKQFRVPVLQALRNYRLICPGSLLHRQGEACHQCVRKFVPVAAIRHGCYRKDRLATGVLSAMLATHRLFGTWKNRVTAYYTPTEFARQRFLDAGFAPERIHVKPNFVASPIPVGSGDGNYFIFVGRLTVEKGIRQLLSAWQKVSGNCGLHFIGAGPLSADINEAAKSDSRIRWLGELPNEEVLSRIARARALVFPSLWYETFGRCIAEAFSVGTPVITTQDGAMAELVRDQHDGVLYPAKNVELLAAALQSFSKDCSDRKAFRKNAFETYRARFTPAQNYKMLLDIYHKIGVNGIDDNEALPKDQRSEDACRKSAEAIL